MLDERGQARTHIVAAAALGGIEAYSLDGRRRGATPAGEAAGLSVTYDFPLNGAPVTLLATTDGANNALRFYTYRQGAISDVSAETVALPFAAENVCFYRHAADGAHYIFILGDDGEIDQQLVYQTADGRVAARPVRRVNVPSTLKQCVTDSASGVAYASEEGVGIWRFNADPESDVEAVLIDSARFGQLGGEVGGVTLYDGGEGARWLLASAAEAGQVHVYDRGNDDAFIGASALPLPAAANRWASPARSMP